MHADFKQRFDGSSVAPAKESNILSFANESESARARLMRLKFAQAASTCVMRLALTGSGRGSSWSAA
eukprot:3429148-Pyramimonas_sp.AAC.1